MKTDNRIDLEKTFENALVEFIKNDRYKNISDNPKTYIGYFYFVNGEFELRFKFIPRNYDDKYMILQYDSADGEFCIVLLLNIYSNSGTFIIFSKVGEFKYRIVKDLTIETVYDEKYQTNVSKVYCTFDGFVNISSSVDDYMEDINGYSDIKYFKVVRSNDKYPVEDVLGLFMDFFVSFKNHKDEENEWKIFYSGFVDCDIQWIDDLTGINYDSHKNILTISTEFDSDAYELLIIFKETSGEKHFVRILHGSKIALLDEIYGSKKVKVVQYQATDYKYDFNVRMNLDQYLERQIYIKQLKWNVYQ